VERIDGGWILDPEVTFLNHGSFGACPRAVLAAQRALQDELERQPVRFLARELFARLDAARAEAAAFVGADPEGFVFVPNATYAVNGVLRGLDLRAGDELLITDHGYGACKNALEYVAGRSGARVVVAPVPWPVSGPDAVVEAVLAHVGPRTRLALVDHITSPTGLVFPVERLVRELAARGVETLVDGAHGPGMVPLDVRALGAAWYTGNFHKWVCAPKGAAFLYVREDRRADALPLAISHGWRFPVPGRSRFQTTFDWTGTDDPTPYLAVPAALRHLAAIGGGWDAIRARNRALALEARRLLCAALDVAPPAPDEMIGTLAAVPLPDGDGPPPTSFLYTDPLQDALLERYGIEVPIVPWPAPPRRLVRISAQLYNAPADYERLGRALNELL
jgi:isopenicillin-N epimerase